MDAAERRLAPFTQPDKLRPDQIPRDLQLAGIGGAHQHRAVAPRIGRPAPNTNEEARHHEHRRQAP